jgi:hypothetical protein
MKRHLLIIVTLIGLTACTEKAIPASPTHTLVPVVSTQTPLPIATATPLLPTPTFAPGAWMEQPVIPVFSETARLIFQRGLELARDPDSFSKAGDCESTTGWYLAEFDGDPPTYRLGGYAYLQTTIDYYAGSFKRESLAVRRGANTSSLLTALWADPAQCRSGESMLACEFRVHNPSIVLIAVGSNDVVNVDNFEEQMRRIIDYTISEGIVPILSTKADNFEGDHRINNIIARLAYEYEIPLWNFWLAVQPLPNHGLSSDGVHLTFAGNLFDDPVNMQKAWPWRNLTALQVLDAARQALVLP